MARKAEPGKKDTIINAATTVFAQSGYANTRIVEVARVAGVGKGTIYEYFRSKEDLFFATFQQLFDTSQDQMSTLLTDDGSTAADRLRAVGEGLLATWLPNLETYGLVLEFWSAAAALPGRERFRDVFKTVYADFRTVLSALIQGGIDSGEFDPVPAEALASALIGAWDAILLQAWLDPDFDAMAASEAHLSVLLKGLVHKQG